MSRSRWASVVAALLVGALSALMPASSALAHTELTATAPAAKSTVTKAITTVTLTFSGLIKKAGAEVIVTGADGVSHSDGAARQVDKKITQKIKPLPVGAVKVAWRAVAADGHPMKGSFTFTNRAAPPAASPTPPATPSTGPDSAPTTGAPTTGAPVTSVAGASSAPAVIPVAGSGDDGGDGGAMGWVIAGVAVVVLALLGGGLWWRRRAG